MTLYEIDAAIAECFDEETGEIFSEEALNNLIMEREKKLEGVALKIKNLRASAKAIREEEQNLAERRKAIENGADRAEEWLLYALDGASFETPRVRISYRSSEAVVYDPEQKEQIIRFLEDRNQDHCIKYSLPEINKTELKKLLKEGFQSDLFSLEKRSNMQIK